MFNYCLNELIWYVNDLHIPTFLCIYCGGQKHWFKRCSWIYGFFLINGDALFVIDIHHPSFNGVLFLIFDKWMVIYNIIVLFLADGMLVWCFECVAEVQLFYLIWHCINSSCSKYFHVWFHRYLSHGIIYHMVSIIPLVWSYVGVWTNIREWKNHSTANFIHSCLIFISAKRNNYF